MKATLENTKATYDPTLDKYTNVVLFAEHNARAEAILTKAGLPAQYNRNGEAEAQKAKEKAVGLCSELKAERLRQHLSQTALANKVGMQKEFVSRIENGRVDIQLSTFLKIVEGLGLKVAVK